jgi:hypothetical protein
MVTDTSRAVLPSLQHTAARQLSCLIIHENTSDDETVVHSNLKRTVCDAPYTKYLKHTVSDAPYTKYGMVSRKLLQRKLGALSCLILCKGWPSWFWVVRARNFDVKMVMLASPQWKGLLQSLYPATEVYVWSEWFGTLPVVDYVMSDYDLKGTKLNILWFYTLKHIILAKASRSPQSGWVYKKFHMTHLECGGVTTGSWHIHLYSSRAESMPLSMSPQVEHDASTILNATVTGGRPVAAPISLAGKAAIGPSLLELRPNTFHGGGLIPWGAKPFWVITPNIYSPTKWCVHRLTQVEILYSRDVSQEMATTYLKPKDLSILYTDLTFIPGKVCRVFLDSLLQHNPPDSHTQNSVRHPMCLVGSHADIAQGHPKGLVANSATLAQADSLDWESRILMEQEQRRMQTATKSDDAEVPEHLWDSRILPHLLQGERTKIQSPFELWPSVGGDATYYEIS